jgi:hypothetical protein
MSKKLYWLRYFGISLFILILMEIVVITAYSYLLHPYNIKVYKEIQQWNVNKIEKVLHDYKEKIPNDLRKALFDIVHNEIKFDTAIEKESRNYYTIWNQVVVVICGLLSLFGLLWMKTRTIVIDINGTELKVLQQYKKGEKK